MGAAMATAAAPKTNPNIDAAFNNRNKAFPFQKHLPPCGQRYFQFRIFRIFRIYRPPLDSQERPPHRAASACQSNLP